MKRIFLMCAFLIAAIQFTKAQATVVNGNVKNERGNPLHFVFVQDHQSGTATFTDSLGNFSITTSPNSPLDFRRKGYAEALANAAGNTSMQVVLKSDSAAGKNSAALSTGAGDNTNEHLSRISGTDMQATDLLHFAHKKDQVVGNKYLFEDFVHGFVTNIAGQMVYNNEYLYDYDKMEGGLLFTSDGKSVAEINRDQINSFMLFSNHDEAFVFKIVPVIDKVHYTQVLSSGKKYDIYKFTATKFLKSDYVAAGLTSHGNNYDEYRDDAVYYVFDVAGNKLQPLPLKKKAIKTVFAAEGDKVTKYMSDNSGDINDAYLSKLGDYLNR